MSTNIVLLASGTRGDVQPYVALGRGLCKAGYRVRIAAPTRFAEMITGQGLGYAALESNPSDLMVRPGGQAALTSGAGWLTGLRGSMQFVRDARPLYANMLAEARQACQGADAVIVGLASIWGLHIAESLGIPCVGAFLQPFGCSAAQPTALLPFQRNSRPALNRLSHRLVEQAVWQPWRGVINAWRSEQGLERARWLSPYRRFADGSIAVVYGYSAQVAPPPADWPGNHTVCGYWFLDTEGWQPTVGLAHFLAAGAPPIYVGFGSPGTAHPQHAAAILVEALHETNLRAVTDLPARMLPAHAHSQQLFALETTPHDWLFPRMAGLVHHGGAGTTGAGLRAGKPALITPLGVDQFFWAGRVDALGVGPEPLPQRRLTASLLAARLREMVDHQVLRERALALGEAIRGEDGVESAVAAIRQALGG